MIFFITFRILAKFQVDLFNLLYFRFMDIAELIPQINPGGSNRILKHEMKQMLNKMAYYMEDIEFEKLWKR